MKDRKDIIADNPIVPFLMKHGHTIQGKLGGEQTTLCCFHDDHHPSMRVNEAKQTWHCDVCKKGGSVIDYLMEKDNISVKEAMEILAGEEAQEVEAKPDDTKMAGDVAFKTVDTYEYQDEHGRLGFCVDRQEQFGGRKKFMQYHKENGKRVYGMDGVRRVLYRLPQVIQAKEVWLVEGEKCVHALESLGRTATTNPGGSGAWLDAYSSFLEDSHVTICPDNDEPGSKWLDAVLASLEGKVASTQVVRLPDTYNDVADVIDMDGKEEAESLLMDLAMKAPRVDRGVDIPLLNREEALQDHIEYTCSPQKAVVDLGKWLPTLSNGKYGKRIRPLVSGELCVVMAGTGIGKSAALQNIAICHPETPVLFFSLELPAAEITERFIALSNDISAEEVERRVKGGHIFQADKWKHIFICPDAMMDLEKMKEITQKSELKIGCKPGIIIIDYIGLMKGGFGKRYERLSTIAEGLKVLAKETNTVVIVASQVRRKPEENEEITLFDAKDSGSIENSAQLVLGMWRPDIENSNHMVVRVTKGTKGGALTEVKCTFRGDRMRITENAIQEEYE